MLLKKLIVSGFKSFADKVTLHFDDGITGIVGPNGSGKSNVIDAVRWVMGEQNAKHLRGQVATDIIFAGSDKRKALGMAEVTLVFDNSDASSFCPPEYRHEPEISLTRRLYIDGQREYLINKKPCRLKDIVGFFATTGLGGRSYSMIQQGQVDRILNAKPEDVREILEEAAGTLVFKNRRTAANKKLDSAQENLSRIEDIVTELESRIGALKGQVETAEKWKHLTEEHRSKELQVFKHNHSFFGEKLTELEVEWNKRSDEESFCFTEITNLEAQVETLQQRLAEADPEVEQLHEQVAVLREQITSAEGAIEMSKLKISQAENRIVKLNEEIVEETKGYDELNAQYTEALEKFEKAKTDSDEHQAVMDNFQEEVDQVEEAANVFAGRSQELEQEVKNIDLYLESNTVRCESIEKDRQRIVLDKKKFSEKREELLQKLSEANVNVDKFQEVLDQKQEGLEEHVSKKLDLEESIVSLDELLEEKSRVKDSLKEEYLTKNARLVSLKELEMSSVDVLSVKQKINDYDPSLSSVYLLAEQVSFNDKSSKLSKELSSSLEKWFEKLVVKTESDFDKVRQYSKIESLGEFSISIEELWNKPSSSDIKSWASSSGLESVSEYVSSIDASSSVSSLLERLYIVPSDKDLFEVLSTSVPSSVIIFSHDGFIFSDKINIKKTYENSSGILSRRKELETLEGELVTLKDTLESIESEVLDSDEIVSEQRFNLDPLKNI